MNRDIPPCSSCHGPCDRFPQRYCRACHARYMRENRPAYSELSTQARRKAICRSYANTYQRRGKLEEKPCEDCGARPAEKHHDDYEKPLQVRWKCRACHAAHHQREKVPHGTSRITA